MLQLQNKQQQVWYHLFHQLPDALVTGHWSNQPAGIAKAGNRDGAGILREQLLYNISFPGSKIATARLLPDIHAFVKLLIFPQHLFW